MHALVKEKEAVIDQALPRMRELTEVMPRMQELIESVGQKEVELKFLRAQATGAAAQAGVHAGSGGASS
jgi:hypothetical protein